MMFLNKNKPVVVVEIGNDWLKIAEGKVCAGAVSITKAVFFKISQINDSIFDKISKVFREMKFDKQCVIVCLPRQLVTVRTLELPSIDPVEISEIINLQIGKQTPYSKDEIVYSYKIIGRRKEGYTSVMLVIATRNLIDARMEVLSKASIEIEEVALSSEGVYRWFNSFYLQKLKLQDSEAVILVDIDSNYSDFIITHKGDPVSSKNILIGANHLIEEKDNYINKFTDELKHSINAFYEEKGAVKAVKMFLSGAAKNIKDLDVILSAQLDMPCEVIDAVKDAKMETNTAFLNEDNKYISFSPIFGILLSRRKLVFSLLPNEKRIQKMMDAKRRNLTMMGILSSAIIMALSALMLVNIYHKNVYMTGIKQRVALIKNDSDETDRMRLTVNLLRDRLDARGDSINLLNEAYKLIPKEVYLTGIDIERRKQVILKGRAQAMSDIFKFVTALEKSPYFESVKNTYATTKKEDDNEFVDFEIIAAYEGPRGR
ncbi:MAG: pilus assembly protein PilM [Candidatus Omnitrophota bacterium]|nr:pilus assembly protein PilM [Candidatus Omnitrophota bacterium]